MLQFNSMRGRQYKRKNPVIKIKRGTGPEPQNMKFRPGPVSPEPGFQVP
jgi:hypothetical protein